MTILKNVMAHSCSVYFYLRSPFSASFSSFHNSWQYTLNIIFCRWLDSNRGSLMMEVTALPTGSHHCPCVLCFQQFTHKLCSTKYCHWLDSNPSHHEVATLSQPLTTTRLVQGQWYCWRHHKNEYSLPGGDISKLFCCPEISAKKIL